MERKIDCCVFTPDGQVYRGEIDLAVIPALKGEIGFLYNHAHLIAELDVGELRLRSGQDTDYLIVEGGFAEINGNELSICPVNAYRKEDLFKEDIEGEIKRLEKLIKPFDYLGREKIMGEIRKLNIKLKVANR
jgi:F-type H+-transporting ATPase subunit epsilon